MTSEFSKDDCVKWQFDKLFNPKTGRKIKENGPTYKKISKQYNFFFNNNEETKEVEEIEKLNINIKNLQINEINNYIPEIKTIYIFTYAYRIKFFAYIDKITQKQVKFQVIGTTRISKENEILYSSDIIKPNLNKLLDSFYVAKKSFDDTGFVTASYNQSSGHIYDENKTELEEFYH